ncbi:hypothetical protein C7E15_22970, partial [Stenotrophomonas maltophilia]
AATAAPAWGAADAGAQPFLRCPAAGVVAGLCGSAGGQPPLLRLRGVPPMRVLNRSFAALPPASLLAYVAA